MDAENKLQDLSTIVTDLVINKGIFYEDVKKKIHTAIMDAVKGLPKIPVLYNALLGEYGHSNLFNDFLVEEDVTYDIDDKMTRVKLVKYVQKFGDKCKEDFPMIARMVSTYNFLKLHLAFEHICNLKHVKAQLENISLLKQKVLETESNLFGDKIVDIKCINIDLFPTSHVFRYEKTSLVTFFDKQFEVFQEKLKSIQAMLFDDVGDVEMCKDMCESIENNYDTMTKKWTHNLIKTGIVKLSFTDAVSKYGEYYFVIWLCQSYYKKEAMWFLLNYPKYMLDDTNTCSSIEMGLLCASSNYNKLAIGHVPPHINWYIGNDDGIESICIPMKFN